MRLLPFLSLWLGLLGIAGGATTASAEGSPEKIKVGVFVTNLFDINFARHDVEAQFWVWFNHADAAFDSRKSVEIVNARSTDVASSYRTPLEGGAYWDQVKYSAVLDEAWRVADFPFDRQRIEIVLESTEADARKLQFVPDVEGTKLRRDMRLPGWKIEGIKISASNETYETAYGDPSLNPNGPSIYPRVTVVVDVKRDGWRLMLSTFIGFFLSIALAGIVLTSNAFRRLSEVIDMGAQLAVGTGALFSTIGAGYILQGGLPPTTEFSLADAFQLAAFAVTFLTMLSIFGVHVLRNKKNPETALLVGRTLFLLYLVSVALIVYRVYAAVAA